MRTDPIADREATERALIRAAETQIWTEPLRAKLVHAVEQRGIRVSRYDSPGDLADTLRLMHRYRGGRVGDLRYEARMALTAREARWIRIALVFGDPALAGCPDEILERAKAKLRLIEKNERERESERARTGPGSRTNVK